MFRNPAGGSGGNGVGVKAAFDRYMRELKDWFDLRHGDRNSRAFVAVGLVAVMVVSGLAITLGSSQKTSLLNLLDGHGWLSSNQASTLVLADGSTAKVDLSLSVKNSGTSEMVRVGGTDVLVNKSSGGTSTSYLDLGSFKVRPGVVVSQGSSSIDVVAGTKVLYTIDKNTGVITARNPVTMHKVGSVNLGGQLTNGQTDSAGRLWVVNTSNGLLESANVVAGQLVSGNGAQIVAPHTARSQVELTMANDHPVVLDLAKQLLVAAPDGTPGASLSVPKLPSGSNVEMPGTVQSHVIPLSVSGQSDAEVLLAQVTPDGSPSAFITRQPGSINAGDTLGTPQAYTGKVYVPDATTGEVVVLDEQGEQTDAFKAGNPGANLDLSLQGGDLWINQPDGNNAFVVNPSGIPQEINKQDAPITNVSTPPTTIPPPTVPPTTLPPVAPVATPSTPSAPTATTVPPQVPLAPTLTANGGNATATLTWSVPYDGGSPIDTWTYSWTVAKGKGSSGSQTVQASTDPTGVTATGLTNGSTYSFTVTAHNAVGNSPASPAETASPTADVPSAPTGVTAMDNHDGSIKVSWNPADGAGHVITGYQLAVTDTTTAANSPVPVPVTAPSDATANVTQTLTTKTGLILGDSYTFTVIAKNDLGNVSVKSTATAAATSDSVPLGVSAPGASVGVGQATLTWTCVVTNVSCSGGSTVTQFKIVTVPAVAVPPVQAGTSTSGSYSVTVSGLANMTPYTMTIAACNANGCQVLPTSVGTLTTPGQPTFSLAPTGSANGLTGTVSFGVNTNRATGVTCSVTTTFGNSSSCTGFSAGLPFYSTAYSGTVTVSSIGFSAISAPINAFSSGPKSLTADATGAFGNCTSPGVPAYCGSGSHSCPSPAWSSTACANAVAGGTGLTADSCTTGGPDSGNGGNSSSVWVHIVGYGGYPWMNLMFLNGGAWQSAAANLPGC